MLEGMLSNVRPDFAVDHLHQRQTPIATESMSGSMGLLSDLEAGEQGASLSSTKQSEVTALLHLSGPEIGSQQPAKSTTEDVDDLSSEIALLCLSATGRSTHYLGASSSFGSPKSSPRPFAVCEAKILV
jgi:hypothetical protein